MKVLVEVYDSCKYEAGNKKVGEARYDIEKFEVKQISRKSSKWASTKSITAGST